MSTFLEKLSTNCGSGVDNEIIPHARYFPSMDFLLYLREDYSYRADRVDAFLTVLWHPNEEHLIGIKLKGFRFLFQQLKPLLELKEDAFFPLVKALEIALVGGVAEHIINAVERERLEDLYGKARELVADISVSPEEWMRAAA